MLFCLSSSRIILFTCHQEKYHLYCDIYLSDLKKVSNRINHQVPLCNIVKSEDTMYGWLKAKQQVTIQRRVGSRMDIDHASIFLQKCIGIGFESVALTMLVLLSRRVLRQQSPGTAHHHTRIAAVT